MTTRQVVEIHQASHFMIFLHVIFCTSIRNSHVRVFGQTYGEHQRETRDKKTSTCRRRHMNKTELPSLFPRLCLPSSLDECIRFRWKIVYKTLFKSTENPRELAIRWRLPLGQIGCLRFDGLRSELFLALELHRLSLSFSLPLEEFSSLSGIEYPIQRY